MTDGKDSLNIHANELESIIIDFYDDIYRFCFWKVRNEADAQDLTQETFLHFLDKLDRYSDLGKPQALLYTIARHLCINHLKRKRETPLDETSVGNMVSLRDSTNDVINRIDLFNAVSTLPDIQQEVLLLRYGQELRVGEIASILGVSRFTVMYRLRCAAAGLEKITREVDTP